MKRRRYRTNNPFASMQNAAVGLASVGVSTAVGAGVAAHAPAGTPNMTQGFNALAGMTPIAVTGNIGMSLLPKRKKRNKYGY